MKQNRKFPSLNPHSIVIWLPVRHCHLGTETQPLQASNFLHLYLSSRERQGAGLSQNILLRTLPAQSGIHFFLPNSSIHHAGSKGTGSLFCRVSQGGWQTRLIGEWDITQCQKLFSILKTVLFSIYGGGRGHLWDCFAAAATQWQVKSSQQAGLTSAAALGRTCAISWQSGEVNWAPIIPWYHKCDSQTSWLQFLKCEATGSSRKLALQPAAQFRLKFPAPPSSQISSFLLRQ